MMFNFAKRSHFLQEFVIKIVSAIHPSIEHNLDKIAVLKKAFWHCELEKIEGAYFEFGIYEGTSLYSALQNYRKLRSPIRRQFYGFDSFDDGFKYFDTKDHHPFFKEGDFKSSYARAVERFKKYPEVHLVKGYFEETIAGVDIRARYPDERCAIVFIDCDLMNPALVALEFVAPALEEGSVIILDDYWAYRGDPKRGTCGAFRAWLEHHPEIGVRWYSSYGHGGQSFIMYTRVRDQALPQILL
ncbi:MAG: class I SAM-dependent methyltransferase [Patescibacteria group bacterium]